MRALVVTGLASAARTCECGCDQPVDPKRRFVSGHNLTGKQNPRWRGGRSQTGVGYEAIKSHGRHYKREHVAVVEGVIGPLPPGAVVHHIDEDKRNNARGNLVVCQDRAYHNLIHRRLRALRACGNADWRRCPICKSYDDPQNMRLYEVTNRGRIEERAVHSRCSSNARRRYER